MKKTFTKLATTLMLLLTITFTTRAASYTLQLADVSFDETTGTITDYLNTTEKDIVIPDSFNVNGKNVAVIAIGNNAFYNKSLTSVTIPNSVTTMGTDAFSYNGLTSVTIPNSVTTIVGYTFRYNSLTSVTIGNSVTTIGSNAFTGNALTSIIIPNSVITIGDGAFLYNGLTSVIIPNSVTTIGSNAFLNNSLTSVTLGNNITSIAYQAFNNNAIVEVNGQSHNGLFYARNSDASIDSSTTVSYGGVADIIDFIPNSVTTIGLRTFYNNAITSVIIPKSVTTIGQRAFFKNALTTVTIPNSVTSIGEGAFENNSLVSAIISDNVTSIGDDTFLDNNLTSITIPNSVTSIGYAAFGVNSLKLVTIPSSVTTIGKYAFYENNFTSIQLPEHPNLNSYAWVDGNGETYTGGDSVSNLEIKYSLPDAYNVYYELDGGINAANNPIAYHKDAGVSSFESATKGGCIFNGWFNANDVEVTSIPVGTEADTVLYAKWENISGVYEPIKNNANIYPNPASYNVTIKGAEGESVKIYNMQGILLQVIKVVGENQVISISELPKGTYLIQVGDTVSKLSVVE